MSAPPAFLGRHDAIRRGTVARFDDAAGLGTVVDEQGREFAFHCTAIADGTRQIDQGAAVCFTLAALGAGQVEARELTARSARPASAQR